VNIPSCHTKYLNWPLLFAHFNIIEHIIIKDILLFILPSKLSVMPNNTSNIFIYTSTLPLGTSSSRTFLIQNSLELRNCHMPSSMNNTDQGLGKIKKTK